MDDGGIYAAIAAYEAQIERQEEKIEKIDAAISAVQTAISELTTQENILNGMQTGTYWKGQNYDDYFEEFTGGLLEEQTAYKNQVAELLGTLENARSACYDLIREYQERIQELRKQLQLLRAKKKR